VRSRYGRKIKAYGIFCFTSNSGISSERAIKKRLYIVMFDMLDAKILLFVFQVEINVTSTVFGEIDNSPLTRRFEFFRKVIV